MTAKTPDSPQESRPPAAASSTSSVPQQPAEPPTTTTALVPVTKTPTTPPAPPPAPPVKPKGKAAAGKPRRGSGLAYVVSVLAVLIALGSTVVALYALDVAREAKSRTADTAGAPATGAAAGASPSASPSPPSPTPTRPRVQFVPESVRAELRIPPADGCVSVFVDLDSLQVGVDNGHEFYLSNCLGSLALRIDKTSGAVPTQQSPSPEVCVAQLAGANPNIELVLPVRAGLTFCLLTNKDEATRQGQPQRVGIVEVRDVNTDRSVTVAVSTYRVPE